MSEPTYIRMNDPEYRRLAKLSKEEIIGLLFASRSGREFAEARVKELEAANEVLAYNLTDDVQRIREYKNEWELCCERERAR